MPCSFYIRCFNSMGLQNTVIDNLLHTACLFVALKRCQVIYFIKKRASFLKLIWNELGLLTAKSVIFKIEGFWLMGKTGFEKAISLKFQSSLCFPAGICHGHWTQTMRSERRGRRWKWGVPSLRLKRNTLQCWMHPVTRALSPTWSAELHRPTWPFW